MKEKDYVEIKEFLEKKGIKTYMLIGDECTSIYASKLDILNMLTQCIHKLYIDGHLEKDEIELMFKLVSVDKDKEKEVLFNILKQQLEDLKDIIKD